jgi:TRAP-type C4-dicarboxylate transport system substrate-binding protein
MSALAGTASSALVRFTAWIAAMAIGLLLPWSAAAEPIRLRLSYFDSDRGQTYLSAVKAFVDAVNAEGDGLVAIDVYANGALGTLQAQQPQLVLDGVADIAFIVPGVTPYRFPDNVLLEHPGLLSDAREGTLVYTRLIADKVLRGYEDFFVIGAYTSTPNFFHSRKPIESLGDLKGQKIRANNPALADALRILNVIPSVMEPQKLAHAIGNGAIDGAAMSWTGVLEFNVAPVAANHYLLNGGLAPLALVMNRNTFNRLPEAAKSLIRKYSGERAAATWIGSYGIAEKQLLEKLKSDPGHRVTEPTPTDLKAAQQIFQTRIDIWAAKSTRNNELLTLVETELAGIRASP